MSSERSLHATARVFFAALYSLDPAALSMVASDDVTWWVPGTGRIAGVHVGVPSLITAATAMRHNGISVTVERLLTGGDGVTVITREVGDAIGRDLDVRVTVTLTIHDGQVRSAIGYVSDLLRYDTYWH